MSLRDALVTPALRDDGLSVDQPRALGALRTNLSWIVFLGVVIVFTVLMSVVAAVANWSGWAPAVGQLIGAVAGYIAMIAIERRWGRAFEVQGWRGASGLVIGLAAGALLCALCVGVLTVAGLRVFDGVASSVPDDLGITLLTVGLIAGISEEIIFRGVMYRLVERGLGTWGAVAISGVIFGLAHIANPEATLWGAIAIAIEAGLMFAVVYAICRNLWVLIGIHAAWNITQGPIFGSVISGTSSEGSGLLVSRPAGPELLSGGAFGIEASLITVVILSLITVFGAWWLHRSGRVVAPRWVRRREHRDTGVSASTTASSATVMGRD